MSDPHEHAGQDPGAHVHGHPGHESAGAHGPVVHQAPEGREDAYRRAYEAAQPAPGRRVVPVDLEAREMDWEGSWMYHCHILEHHAAGMMGHFEV